MYEDALRWYEPEVDCIVRSGSRDVARIEQVLDRLLDFGDDEACLRLYKRLGRHYWNIDKVATAEYVMIYWKMWDEHDASGSLGNAELQLGNPGQEAGLEPVAPR